MDNYSCFLFSLLSSPLLSSPLLSSLFLTASALGVAPIHPSPAKRQRGAAATLAGLSRGFFVASQVLVERLGSWLAAVAVNRAVLIWKLARMGFLTRRDYAGMRLGEIQRIEYFLVDAVVL